MSVNEVLQDVMDRGWFSEEERDFYGKELGMALLGEAVGLPLVCGPEEVFEEVSEIAGLRRNVRAYYARRFKHALRSHRQEVEEFAEVAA